MASVEAYTTAAGERRYRVRYRTPERKQTDKRGFRTKRDAERWLAAVETAKDRGEYVPASAGRVSVAEWSAGWLAAQGHWKPSTAARAASIVRTQIVPRWGPVAIADVSHADVQAWCTQLSATLAPSTVRQVHRMLSLMLDLAVRDGRLVRNPASGVRLPRQRLAPRRFLTHDQVADLAAAAGAHRVLVLTLAYAGLRWGEAAALRVGSLDLLRRRLTVSESVTEVEGRLTWGTPKSHAVRAVPLPQFLVDELAAHVVGWSRVQLVFPSTSGEPLRVGSFRRSSFDRAAAAVGVEGLTPHELRHTAASLAIAAGASIKAVQSMLGHSTATLTLDRYGHLYPDELDALGAALDRAGASSNVGRMWAAGTVSPLGGQPVRERIGG
jgi:integrase